MGTLYVPGRVGKEFRSSEVQELQNGSIGAVLPTVVNSNHFARSQVIKLNLDAALLCILQLLNSCNS